MPTILLLSDIHSNLEALRAVLGDAAEHSDEFDSVCVLGDFIGYGANPNEVVDELLQLPNCHFVKGNHEAAALGEIPTHTFNPTAARAAEWTANHLTAENAKTIRKFPLTKVVGDLTICHGSPRDPIWEYQRCALTFAQNLGYFGTLGCAFGHTHWPCLAGLKGKRSNWLTCPLLPPPAQLHSRDGSSTPAASDSRATVIRGQHTPSSAQQDRCQVQVLLSPRSSFGALPTT